MRAPDSGEPVRRPWLAGVAVLNAVAAWAGGFGLCTGAIDVGESTRERLPFDSPVLAGLALIVIVGVPLTVLAWSAATGRSHTDDLALVAGLLLIAWIVVQIVVLRASSWLQPTYLVIGGGLVVASHELTLGPFGRGVLLVAAGAPLTAVGVGLVPHLLDGGPTVTAAASVGAALAGVALLGVGAASALRGRRPLVVLAGSVALLVVVAVALSTIAPAVAATNVPSTEITSTPTAEGLAYESVTLTTTDGVELAAWFVPGDNGAGVVVMHGAGSTRSDVLDRAAVVARNGYSILLVDARGHGDSGGTAMDFGWYGDLDVAAGTGYLASRPEVEPGRIGVLGFSMGGEEAIGATATDDRIRAVVAEGATARTAADKTWLSDVYGWRGWLQERLEAIQDGVTDYLTDATPPTALRASVARAVDTRFLLITAGAVADEGHAAADIAAAASDRVTVWTVPGARHTGGYEVRPEDWERRVVDFLDRNLASPGT